MTSEWMPAVSFIKPFIYKIITPSGSGTGFQLVYSKTKKLFGVATAYHVIQHAFEWEEPIKLQHYQSNKIIFLKSSEGRAIFSEPEKDLALIVFQNKELPVPETSPTLIPAGKFVNQGKAVGWLGFPSVSPLNACFFAGHISCYQEQDSSYLVDGVAINGVSGGPVFLIEKDSLEKDIKINTRILGVITQYKPNISTGEILPGVSYVRDVEPFQKQVIDFTSFDDAQAQAEQNLNIEKKE